MQTTVNNVAINLPEKVATIPPALASKVPLNGERLDNAAFVVYGSHLAFPDLMKKNNIGFAYDVPSKRKISVW